MKIPPVVVKGTRVVVNHLVIDDQDVAEYLSHVPVDELSEHLREAVQRGVMSFPVERAYQALKKIRDQFEHLDVKFDQELEEALVAIEKELVGILSGKGRMTELIEQYFGEGSVVREIFYPMREEMALHQLLQDFRTEMIDLRRLIDNRK